MDKKTDLITNISKLKTHNMTKLFTKKKNKLSDFSKSAINEKLSSITGGDNFLVSSLTFIFQENNIIITEDIVDLKTTENGHLTIG